MSSSPGADPVRLALVAQLRHLADRLATGAPAGPEDATILEHAIDAVGNPLYVDRHIWQEMTESAVEGFAISLLDDEGTGPPWPAGPCADVRAIVLNVRHGARGQAASAKILDDHANIRGGWRERIVAEYRKRCKPEAFEGDRKYPRLMETLAAGDQ